MSDDLVKRAREYGDDPQDVSLGEWAEWSHKWADRIEELEAKLAKPRSLCQGKYLACRIEGLEAKLAKATEALERIVGGEFDGVLLLSLPPQDAAKSYAASILAELKRDRK